MIIAAADSYLWPMTNSAAGDLSAEVDKMNFLAMPLLGMQSSLKHLTWQASQVADGNLGNKFSKGRPAGSRNKVSIAAMNLLKDEEEALSRKAIDSALNGNTQMLQFCLSRLLPPVLRKNQSETNISATHHSLYGD
jgi:hypothetical protein